MKKYKYLGNLGVFYDSPKPGEVYSENYTWGNKLHTVGELAVKYPNNKWQLIFTLPKKWCIRITEENREILEDYRKTTKFYNPKSNSTALHPHALSGWLINTDYSSDGMNWNSNKIPTNYTEITFEQFKKYVLMSKEKTFPREMLVWDTDEDTASIETVLGIFPEREEYPVITIETIYIHAKELPETLKEVELTIEEIAVKFGIDPKSIRIKE